MNEILDSLPQNEFLGMFMFMLVQLLRYTECCALVHKGPATLNQVNRTWHHLCSAVLQKYSL